MLISPRTLCALLLPFAMLLAGAAAAGESALETTARRGRVEIIEHEPGTGRPITNHAFAVVHFTAWLYDVELIDVVPQSAPPDE